MNPEETTTTDPVESTTDPTYIEPTTTETYNIVSLDEVQFQTIASISQRTDLLTNRVETMLIFNIVLLCLFIFALMRSRT